MTVAVGVRTPREQQDIALPLVIPFGMEMLDIFVQHRHSSFRRKD
jgi:hypothetical protein